MVNKHDRIMRRWGDLADDRECDARRLRGQIVCR